MLIDTVQYSAFKLSNERERERDRVQAHLLVSVVCNDRSFLTVEKGF